MASSWRKAVSVLSQELTSGWAVTGTCALALHGMEVQPRDLDILATEEAIEVVAAKFESVLTEDGTQYARDDLRADRRVALDLDGISVEVLANLRNVVGGSETTPLDLAAAVNVAGIPVVPLDDLAVVYRSMGRTARADAIATFARR